MIKAVSDCDGLSHAGDMDIFTLAESVWISPATTGKKIWKWRATWPPQNHFLGRCPCWFGFASKLLGHKDVGRTVTANFSEAVFGIFEHADLNFQKWPVWIFKWSIWKCKRSIWIFKCCPFCCPGGIWIFKCVIWIFEWAHLNFRIGPFEFSNGPIWKFKSFYEDSSRSTNMTMCVRATMEHFLDVFANGLFTRSPQKST